MLVMAGSGRLTSAGRMSRRCRGDTIRRVDALLGTCSLPQLRRRTSVKWRAYPGDVLPAFVAEMDFDLAAPITSGFVPYSLVKRMRKR